MNYQRCFRLLSNNNKTLINNKQQLCCFSNIINKNNSNNNSTMSEEEFQKAFQKLSNESFEKQAKENEALLELQRTGKHNNAQDFRTLLSRRKNNTLEHKRYNEIDILASLRKKKLNLQYDSEEEKKLALNDLAQYEIIVLKNKES